MTAKIMLVAGLVVVIGFAVAGVVYITRPLEWEAARPPEKAVRPGAPEQAGNPARWATEPAVTPAASGAIPAAVTERSSPEQDTAPLPDAWHLAVEGQPPSESPGADEGPGAKANPTPSPTVAPITKEVARSALRLVGADPEAEKVWHQAINDPSRPANERQDLIEDLNEEGFRDPRNLTADDLPLIMSRIELIEQFGPDAMDEVNAAAFQEAYKDLLNMAQHVRVTESEKPE